MATYAELLTIATTSDAFKQKIKVACIVACEVIRSESTNTANHAARLGWARSTLSNPDMAATQMVLAVLAQNKDLTAAQITGASDESVQTAVNAAVDLLAA